MQTKLLAGFENFNFVDEIEIPLYWMQLSKNKDLVKENFLNDPIFMKVFGEASLISVQTNPVFVCGLGVYSPEVRAASPLQDTVNILNNTAVVLKNFVNMLWFIKDCCCNNEIIMLIAPETNNWSIMKESTDFHAANGKRETVDFNSAEIKNVIEIMDIWSSRPTLRPSDFLPPADEDYSPHDGYHFSTTVNKTSYNDYSRIERAMYFLGSARMAELIPMKVGMYIPLLECLFSNSSSSTEIAHTVAFRTATYLDTSREEKYGIYEIIKKSYGIRSAYLHGSRLDKKHKHLEKQLETCIEIDNIVRRVMNKIILQDSEMFLDEKALEDKFRSFLF